jgi:hypothetical protein
MNDMFVRLPRVIELLFGALLALLVSRTAFGYIKSSVLYSFSGAAQSTDVKEADQEVLKMNEECNAAELRGDVAAMDSFETDDFTHTQANGTVEHKAEYLNGVGSAHTNFYCLIFPRFTFVLMATPRSSRGTFTFGRITTARLPM